ncbi:histidine phosphatase family protein [Paenibacillus sp. Marseille-P2973]|uniref:histidine phosphatase family protein n=1 Tax=Paenibacillus sp. Marseille-P2973 TaxID=1871032 RepID=UPI001B388C15|nr:histidine phosphatase family protein [Paenibacillus sp. Marseille-P2973]MBQ4901187.1 histidine phosphatase family protein [Paenibacillus sp. Marseille-P2973]
MKRLIFSSIFCILLLLHTPSMEASAGILTSRPADPSLLSSLRQGGYILYVRHGEAIVGEDSPSLDFKDCSTQKNLSETGKRQAEKFGEALRSLQIPVQTPVLASPFCRTKQTAALAFGEDKVETDPFWVKIYNLSDSLPPAEQQGILNDFTSVLEELPQPKTNKVIIAHSFPQGIGLGEITNLGTVIVKPRGRGHGYEVVGRLTLDELTSLR